MFFKNTAGQFLHAQMNSRVDGSPLTSAVTLAVTIDNGSQNPSAGTLGHVAGGLWKYAPTIGETNGDVISFQFIHATGVYQNVEMVTREVNVPANLVQIMATTITGTAAQIVAAFTKWFNVASPTGTVNSLPDAIPGATGGLATTDGTKLSQTVDLTSGQTIAATVADKTGYALTSGERTSIADAILARALVSESYAADGATPTVSQMLWMLWSTIGDFSISGTTLTCKKQDGSSSMTFTLNDAANPTSRTRAT